MPGTLNYRPNFGVRSAVRALIVKDQHLLAVRMKRPGFGDFHVLPGGGQAHGETLRQSLRRECLEELQVEPEILTVAYLREYIGSHHGFSRYHHHFHQLEVVFHCNLPHDANLGMGSERDRFQTGISWLPVADLGSANLYPKALARHWNGERFDFPDLYLGDIN